MPSADLPSVGSVYDVFNLGNGIENVYTAIPGASGAADTVSDTLVTPWGDLNLDSLFGGIDAASALDPGDCLHRRSRRGVCCSHRYRPAGVPRPLSASQQAELTSNTKHPRPFAAWDVWRGGESIGAAVGQTAPLSTAELALSYRRKLSHGEPCDHPLSADATVVSAKGNCAESSFPNSSLVQR